MNRDFQFCRCEIPVSIIRLVFIVFLCLLPDRVFASEHPLRILINPTSLWGWMRDSSSDSTKQKIIDLKLRQLDYYRSLGFNMVSYGLESGFFDGLHKEGGRWIYNHGLHEGSADSSLRAMKRAVEKRGM